MKIESLFFEANDWVPNNSALPVLVYRQAVIASDMAAAFVRLFTDNGWEGIWHNGVFDYQHYHTAAHEVLGIADGNAELLIGGPTQSPLSVSKGDCLVLPSGTGHRNLGSSADFLVIGAYPPGQHADIRTDAASQRDMDRIMSVPLPHNDPISGPAGPLVDKWHRKPKRGSAARLS
jgi:uncharacterized protein YjlB